MLPRSERLLSVSLKIRPLLHIAPWRFEVESLQGFAKFSWFQLWSKLFGSCNDLLRCVKHASSLGSDKIKGIRVVVVVIHHINNTVPTSIPNNLAVMIPTMLFIHPIHSFKAKEPSKKHEKKGSI